MHGADAPRPWAASARKERRKAPGRGVQASGALLVAPLGSEAVTEVRSGRSAPVALGLLLVLGAAPAQAAEGGLVLVPDWRILVLLLAVFVGLRYALHPLLVAPLERVLEEREARIEGARARAARIGEEAEQLHTRYREAVQRTRAEAEEARRRALAEVRSEQQRLTREARAEAERETLRARQEVESALGDARAGLRDVAELLAREAAERILGRSLS